MSISIFAEKGRPPSTRQICEALGSTLPLWETIEQFMRHYFQVAGELRFYGSEYGWVVWFRKNDRPLLTLYPQEECFTVQVLLNEKMAEQALDLNPGANVRKLLEDTPHLDEGRWIFIKVQTQQDVTDIRNIMLLKLEKMKARADQEGRNH
jgi:hypothetical protein